MTVDLADLLDADPMRCAAVRGSILEHASGEWLRAMTEAFGVDGQCEPQQCKACLVARRGFWICPAGSEADHHGPFVAAPGEWPAAMRHMTEPELPDVGAAVREAIEAARALQPATRNRHERRRLATLRRRGEML